MTVTVTAIVTVTLTVAAGSDRYCSHVTDDCDIPMDVMNSAVLDSYNHQAPLPSFQDNDKKSSASSEPKSAAARLEEGVRPFSFSALHALNISCPVP